MSAPQTINGYLLALNESLEVSLRSRRRIFWEVTEHLRQAAEEQERRGASAREAERRAIAAFGSPEDVAARFETGVIGRLDRCLALSTRWLHRRAGEHSAGAVFAVVALALSLGAAVAAVGLVFERNAVAAGLVFVGTGTAAVLFYGWPTRRRELHEMLSSQNAVPLWVLLLAYPAIVSCLVLLGGAGVASSWEGLLAGTLTYFGWGAMHSLVEAVVNRAARPYPGATEADRRMDWRAERPWGAALADVVALPIALLALIVAYPAPDDLRVVLAGLLTVVAALAVAVVRLEHGRREKEGYRTFYDQIDPTPGTWTQTRRGAAR